MKLFLVNHSALRGGVVALAVAACVFAGRGEAQNPNANPSYGSVSLTAGFLPDPYIRQVVAGGSIKTNLGGVNAYIADRPDFVLDYAAGNFALTIYAESGANTTLLIQCPDGTWVADDDSGGNQNPLIRFGTPQSGRYSIWVGTFGPNNANASLKITERK